VLHDRSQDELAADAGVTRNFVSAIERGAQGLDAVRLRRLAAAMGVSLADLLADPEPAPADRAR
jgi:transcriptional regulator with XRE-family HTH domain